MDSLDDKEGELENPNYTLIDVECIRCKAISHEPTITIKQSEYDYLNLIRLMVTPNMELSAESNEKIAWNSTCRFIQNMDMEQKGIHLAMMQNIVAQLCVAVTQDPKWSKNVLKDREKKRFDQSKQEAITSSRPPSKTIIDTQEIELGQFMKTFGLKERKPAMKLLGQIKKAAGDWAKATSTQDQAGMKIIENQFIEGLIEKGVLKRVS
jgi:hypothetical protein